MKIAPLPVNEMDRLEALKSYEILDTGSEQSFDDIVNIASLICDSPIAAISLIDSHRQWFKSKLGLNVTETSRDLAFCAHAILEKSVFEVKNASQDPRFMDNPLVKGDPQIQFYAGAPILDKNGFALGAVCVIDKKTKELTSNQKEALASLSRQAMSQIQATQVQRELDAANHQLEVAQTLIESFTHDFEKVAMDQLTQASKNVIWMTDPYKTQMLYVSPGYEKLFEKTCKSLYEDSISFLQAIHPEDRARVVKSFRKQLLGTYHEVFRILTSSKHEKWIQDRSLILPAKEGSSLKVIGVCQEISLQEAIEIQQKNSNKNN